MQTLTVTVQDGFLQDFLTILEHYKGQVQLQNDPNLEHDPYYYARQQQLQEDLKAFQNPDIKPTSHDELWKNVYKHLNTLDT